MKTRLVTFLLGLMAVLMATGTSFAAPPGYQTCAEHGLNAYPEHQSFSYRGAAFSHFTNVDMIMMPESEVVRFMQNGRLETDNPDPGLVHETMEVAMVVNQRNSFGLYGEMEAMAEFEMEGDFVIAVTRSAGLDPAQPNNVQSDEVYFMPVTGVLNTEGDPATWIVRQPVGGTNPNIPGKAPCECDSGVAISRFAASPGAPPVPFCGLGDFTKGGLLFEVVNSLNDMPGFSEHQQLDVCTQMNVLRDGMGRQTASVVGGPQMMNWIDLGVPPDPDQCFRPSECTEMIPAACGLTGTDVQEGINTPTNECLGEKKDVSPLCTVVSKGWKEPIECGGQAPGDNDLESMGACIGAKGLGVSVGSHRQSRIGAKQTMPPVCKVPFKPWCARAVDPGDQSHPDWNQCYNDPSAGHDFWLGLMRCDGSGSGNTPPGYACCEGVENCYCRDVPGAGVEMCVDCSGETCVEFTRRVAGPDPRVGCKEAEGCTDTDTEEGDSESDNSNHDWLCQIAVLCETGVVCPHRQQGTSVYCKEPPDEDQTEDEEESEIAGASEEDDDDSDGDESNEDAKEHTTRPRQAKPIVEPGAEGGDPVLLSNGALVMSSTDLSFPGVRPLEFTRFYDSRSDDKGALGSNWSHNWEINIRAIVPGTAPSWAPEYCVGMNPVATCLMLQEADGSQSLFIYDPVQEVFTPESAVNKVIRAIEGGGYRLRYADGRVQRFNSEGAILSDRDRFGNGFQIHQEMTPLYRAFKRYCTVHADENHDGAPFESSRQRFCLDSSTCAAYDARVCTFLGVILGKQGGEELADVGWEPGLFGGEPIQLPTELNPIPAPWEDEIPPEILNDPQNLDGYLANYKSEMEIAQAYLRRIVGIGYLPESLDGGQRYRPTKVVDDHGRELRFHYDDKTDVSASQLTFGLLERVDGPGGVRIVYEYQRDSSVDEALQERFLTRARREYPAFNSTLGWDDSQWWSHRYAGDYLEFEYTYQDASTANLSGAHARWLSYLERFMGCQSVNEVLCKQLEQVTPGNPCFEANRREAKYRAAIADNIVEVKRAGRLVVQSEYELNPFNYEFDRVTLQHYGGDVSSLGQFQFDYVSAGPVDDQQPATPSNDKTDSFLPSVLKTAYPMETVPSHLAGEEATPGYNCTLEDAFGDENTVCREQEEPLPELAPSLWPGFGNNPTLNCNADHSYANANGSLIECEFSSVEDASRELPGYTPTYDYWDNVIPDGDPELDHPVRTFLTCGQLAARQLGDPFHNQAAGRWIPHSSEPGRRIAHYPQGSRARMNRDMRRICQWSRTVDRDGYATYFGLNFRGQSLVKAQEAQDASGYTYYVLTETLYNADGMKRIEYLPQHHGAASVGHTRYIYEAERFEDPKEYLMPLFWGARTNISSETFVPALPVFNTDQTQDVVGTRTHYQYERLYNQLQQVTKSVLLTDGSEDITGQTTFLFDYQEFAAPTTLSFDKNNHTPADAVLANLYGQFYQGVNWFLKPPPCADSGGCQNSASHTDTAEFKAEMFDWAFANTPFQGTDRNGDQVTGFQHNTAWVGNGVKALPVEIKHKSPNSSDETMTTTISWSPNGLPASITGPAGTTTSYKYYPLGEFGSSTPPGSVGSNQNKGLLAWVQRDAVGEYREDWGPHVGCVDPATPGAYRFLVEGCSPTASAQLASANIPTKVQQALLDTGGQILRTSFSYGYHGHVAREWNGDATDPAAQEIQTITDTDGRLVSRTIVADDPQNNRTTSVTLTKEGWMGAVDVHHIATESQTRYKYNEIGNVVGMCEALQQGACDTVFAIPNPPVSNAYNLTTYTYTGEDLVETMTNGVGVVTEHTYDFDQRLLTSKTHDPGDPTSARETAYTYNAQGQRIRIEHSGTLSEEFEYDGFGRIRTYTDVRDTPWQLAYNSQNASTHLTQTSNPLDSSLVLGSHYIIRDYDGFGRVTSVNEHGLRTTNILRREDGRPIAIDDSDSGTTWISYNVLGQPVWRQAPDGTQTFSVYDPVSQTSTHATFSGGPDSIATATQVLRDRLGEPYEVVEIGMDDSESVTHYGWVAGNLTSLTDPEGNTSSYQYDLGGNLTWSSRPGPSGAITSSHEYDALGRITRTTDGNLWATDYTYNAFGELKTRTLPGLTQNQAWSYDTLGRMTSYTDTCGNITSNEFDPLSGDVTKRRWQPVGSTTPTDLVVVDTRDALGRVTQARHLNPTLGLGSENSVQTNLTYDGLGRIIGDANAVGTHTTQTTSIGYAAVSGLPQINRTVGYPTGLQDAQTLESGKLTAQSISPLAGAVHSITHNWNGTRLGQRTHDYNTQAGVDYASTPVYGNFGYQTAWQVGTTGIDNVYSQIVERDVKHRIRTAWWEFDGGSSAYLDQSRGFEYDPRGALSTVHHADQLGPTGFIVGGHTAATNATVAAASSQLNATVADRWRDATAGGLEAIDYGGTTMWSTPPRSIGHQMQGLTVDGVTTPYTTTQGCDGRVETALGMDFHYDGAGRLSYVTDENSATIKERYWYDAMGRLAAYEDLTTGGIGKRIFGYDGQQMISAVDGGDNPLWEAVWGAGQDELLAYYNHEMPTQDNYITIRNHTNSVVGLHSMLSDTTVAMAEYNAEGRVKTFDPALGTALCQEEGSPGTVCRGPENIAFGFNSMWRSPVSGLVYMRNRMYSPRMAEFISHDPLGYVDSFNPYQFASLDGVNRWDPWGLDDELGGIVKRGLARSGLSSPTLETAAKTYSVREDLKPSGTTKGAFNEAQGAFRFRPQYKGKSGTVKQDSVLNGARRYANGSNNSDDLADFLTVIHEAAHAASFLYDWHPIEDDGSIFGDAGYIENETNELEQDGRLADETLADAVEQIIKIQIEALRLYPTDLEKRGELIKFGIDALSKSGIGNGVDTYTVLHGLEGQETKRVQVPRDTIRKIRAFIEDPNPPTPRPKRKWKTKPSWRDLRETERPSVGNGKGGLSE